MTRVTSAGPRADIGVEAELHVPGVHLVISDKTALVNDKDAKMHNGTLMHNLRHISDHQLEGFSVIPVSDETHGRCLHGPESKGSYEMLRNEYFQPIVEGRPDSV